MIFEQIDFSEMPSNFMFHRLLEKEMIRWEVYEPTTIEADVPFNADWWKFLYWMPKVKKEFYTMAISTADLDVGLIELCRKYGMDFWFFSKHYSFFIKRLEWMRKNNASNHIGELP